MALGELKKNESTLGKQLKKVSSGLKINGAGDGASEYAISKRMTVQVRSLGGAAERAERQGAGECSARRARCHEGLPAKDVHARVAGGK